MSDWFLHPRRRWLVDAFVITWVVVWAVAGVTAGRALDKVSGVTHSAEGAGGAIVRTGESIRDVEVPVAGPIFEEPGEQIIDAGEAAQAQAQEATSDVHVAAVLFGLAVFLVPTLPLLFVYGPIRFLHGRETRALRALLRDHAGDPALDQLLAVRAVAHLPYHRLRALGAPRASDRTLADAVLVREGVRRG